jgi:hypothetical protein
MQVKVHNLNVHPYSEHFRGKLVTIPAMGFVEMDEDESLYFMETFTPPKKDSQGRPDPVYFKKLKREMPEAAPVDPLMCHASGQKAQTVEELAKMIAGYAHLQAGKDEAGEAEIKKQNAALRKENSGLKSRLAAIEERLGIVAEQKVEA